MIRSGMPKKALGFTLIEIQIGLLLLVLIMGLVYGALHLATKSLAKTTDANTVVENMRITSRFLQNQIAQIHPIYWVDRQGTTPVFKGDEDGFVYTGRTVASGNPDQLLLLTIKQEKSRNSHSLQFGQAALKTDENPLNELDDLRFTTLLDDANTIAFSYYGLKDTGAKTAVWTDTWSSKKYLPQLIKCTIVDNTGAAWPELFLSIMTDDVSSLSQFKINIDTSNARSRSSNATNAEAESDAIQ